MPKIRDLLVIAVLFTLILTIPITVNPVREVFADQCKKIDDLDDRLDCYDKEKETTTKKLNDLREEKNDVQTQISELLNKLDVTEAEIISLQNQITELLARLDIINKNLVDKNTQLDEKVKFRNTIIRNFAKRGVLNELEVFVSSARPADLTGFQFSTLTYMFEKSLNLEARRIIEIINSEIDSFEQDKAEAQDLNTQLAATQGQLLAAKTQLETDKTGAEKDLNVLSEKEASYEEKLSHISSKQQEILAAKSGGDNGTVGDYDSPKPKVPDNPFTPAYGFFSYGAYTHYKGMSQYGAKGRADDGKDYKDIIKFYYKKDVDKKDDFPDRICVQGYGEMDFQDYLYGLAEMPSSWPMDALKAQAIAGRTYAYNRFQKQGNCICTSQSCQVFLKSKSDNPPDRWKEAVDETKKKIAGDAPGYYSSTTGGYIQDVGWDTKGSWPNDAYENKADSPWFYWAWYSSSYRFDSDKCGRSHPWLKGDEVVDILNSWVVWRKGDDGDRDRISPISCWDGDPWSHDKMADKAGDLDKKYTSVSGVDVDIGNNGQTSTVSFDTNQGRVSISGAEFKTVFNLRAPGYIALRSRLYDIQHRN